MNSAAATPQTSTIRLWPGSAPGAMGQAPSDEPHLIPFYPPGPGPFAAVIVCPGGAYRKIHLYEGEPTARWLAAEMGIAAFVLNYRVAPYRYPIPLWDAFRAVRVLRHFAPRWKLAPGRIAVMGFSAGGHLAAAAATHFPDAPKDELDEADRASSRPDALVCCYPVIDCGEFAHRATMLNLLGPAPSPELCRLLSLQHAVTPETPPAFLWHTSDDRIVPVEHSLLFALALSRHKVPFALHCFPHCRHGMGMAADHPSSGSWTAPFRQWLLESGFARLPASESTRYGG